MPPDLSRLRPPPFYKRVRLLDLLIENFKKIPMSISERVHALAMVLVAGVLSSTIFISTLSPVQAATVDSSISCFVYTTLNDFGVPQQFQAGKCPATPAQGGAITLVKRVVNTGAGTAAPSDFLLHLTSAGTDVGGSPQQGTSTGMTYSGLTPGIYMVREAGAPLGYSMSFSGNCDTNGILSISSGTIAFCVVTDTYAAQGTTPQSTTAQSMTTNMQTATPTGTLDVVKLVAGTTATSSPASIHVLTSAGSDVAGSPQKGSPLGTLYILTPGLYNVIDPGMSGYNAMYAGNCMMGGAIVVTPAGVSTCIITATPASGTQAASSLVPTSADLSIRAIIIANQTK